MTTIDPKSLLEDRDRLAMALVEAREDCRRLSEELAKIDALRSSNRLIKINYGASPRCRDWQKAPFVANLAAHMQREEGQYLARLRKFARYTPRFQAIALNASDCKVASDPCWLNDWLPGFDAITLYALVAERNPRWYVEVGSGHSTKFVRRAIRDHGLRTRIISIDPAPRSEIDSICDEVIRKPCEDVDPEFFKTLTDEDLVFIDNSHLAFMNTDVTVFFTEILGSLPKGLVFGLHDIYLPYDYPDIWKDRWYNEQYLLLVYLAGGGQSDKIILPNYYVSGKPEFCSALDPFFSTPPFDKVQTRGGIFWMERVGAL